MCKIALVAFNPPRAQPSSIEANVALLIQELLRRAPHRRPALQGFRHAPIRLLAEEFVEEGDRHRRALFGILAAGPPEPPTYGPRGKAQALSEFLLHHGAQHVQAVIGVEETFRPEADD